jgi:hypothetical protein
MDYAGLESLFQWCIRVYQLLGSKVTQAVKRKTVVKANGYGCNEVDRFGALPVATSNGNETLPPVSKGNSSNQSSPRRNFFDLQWDFETRRKPKTTPHDRAVAPADSIDVTSTQYERLDSSWYSQEHI